MAYSQPPSMEGPAEPPEPCLCEVAEGDDAACLFRPHLQRQPVHWGFSLRAHHDRLPEVFPASLLTPAKLKPRLRVILHDDVSNNTVPFTEHLFFPWALSVLHQLCLELQSSW